MISFMLTKPNMATVVIYNSNVAFGLFKEQQKKKRASL